MFFHLRIQDFEAKEQKEQEYAIYQAFVFFVQVTLKATAFVQVCLSRLPF